MSKLVTYLGDYCFEDEGVLRLQLIKRVKGLGVNNVLQLLSQIGVKSSEARTIKLNELAQPQRQQLSLIINEGFTSISRHLANRKSSVISPQYKSQIFYTSDSNLLFLGDYFKSQADLAKKRLIKMKCNVGVRLKSNRKVHGQRTKSTGRKTKIIRGFQKKKKLSKQND